MNRPPRLLITAVFLCHLLLGGGLVTSQLRAQTTNPVSSKNNVCLSALPVALQVAATPQQGDVQGVVHESASGQGDTANVSAVSFEKQGVAMQGVGVALLFGKRQRSQF